MKVTVKELINELIAEENNSSLVKQYNQKEKEFPFGTIYDSADDSLLNEKYKGFKTLLDQFQQNYRKLFAISVSREEQKCDRDEAKTYSEISILFINLIQNLYLNPISYRINELRTKEALEKADKSIRIGKLSIVIALIIAVITFGLQLCNSNKQIPNFDNQMILPQQVDSLNIVSRPSKNSKISVNQ